MMEYKIISSSAWSVEAAVKVLEKKVNDLIKEGWEPIGGVVVVAFNDHVYQSLIKRETAINKS
ncbi:MAG: DUF1737 domain-containing protein [Syntrophales bacterium]|nr:DUF1737 domain-containing protein [Syntrophales bacterium]